VFPKAFQDKVCGQFPANFFERKAQVLKTLGNLDLNGRRASTTTAPADPGVKQDVSVDKTSITVCPVAGWLFSDGGFAIGERADQFLARFGVGNV
jgi:hypothetical protein